MVPLSIPSRYHKHLKNLKGASDFNYVGSRDHVLPSFISTEIICTTNSEYSTVDLTSIIRFVFPKSIMAFLLSKLRFEILEFHKSCDVYQTRCVKCFLIAFFFQPAQEITKPQDFVISLV